MCTATAEPVPSAGPWSIRVTTPSPVDQGTKALFAIKIVGTPTLCGGCESVYDVGCSAEWAWPTLGAGTVRYRLHRLGAEDIATQTWESEFAFFEAGTWQWVVTCADRNGTASTKRMDEGTVVVLAPPAVTPEP